MGEKDHELVPAGPALEALPPGVEEEDLGHLPQQLVPLRVAVEVVDLLEVVQVQEQQGGGAGPGLEGLLHPGQDAAVVQQAGEGVGLRPDPGGLELLQPGLFLQEDLRHVGAAEEDHLRLAVVVAIGQPLAGIAPDGVHHPHGEGIGVLPLQLPADVVPLHLVDAHVLVLRHHVGPGIVLQGGVVVLPGLRGEGGAGRPAVEGDVAVVLHVQADEVVAGVVDIQVDDAPQQVLLVVLPDEETGRPVPLVILAQGGGHGDPAGPPSLDVGQVLDDLPLPPAGGPQQGLAGEALLEQGVAVPGEHGGVPGRVRAPGQGLPRLGGVLPVQEDGHGVPDRVHRHHGEEHAVQGPLQGLRQRGFLGVGSGVCHGIASCPPGKKGGGYFLYFTTNFPGFPCPIFPRGRTGKKPENPRKTVAISQQTRYNRNSNRFVTES